MKQNTKVLEEAYKKIIADKELQKKFIQATTKDELEKFLKDQKIEATFEEVKEYLTEKFTRKDGELSKAELDLAAGGDKGGLTTSDWVFGSILTAGLYCAINGILNAATDN